MKKKRLTFLLIFLLFLPSSVFATPLDSYQLGQFQLGSMKLIYEDISINTYKVYNTHYVAVSDLKQLGLNITYTAANKTVSILLPSTPLSTTTAPALSIDNTSFSNYTGTVYIGNLQTQSLISDHRTFIPLAALGQIGTLSFSDDTCTFVPTGNVPIVATETDLTNLYNAPLQVTLLDIYWDDEAILKTSSYTLNANEVLSRTPSVDLKEALYVATIVQGAVGGEINYINRSYLGQLNEPLLEKYTYLKNRISQDDLGDALSLDQVLWAEDIVNNNNITSPTNYLVWTNISQQRTYIFEGSTNHWYLIKSFICSTGKDYTPTPKGTFALTYKVPSFGQNKGYCCKYAFGFIGTSYLYHSIIFDKTGTYLLENKGVLGKKASDGCIRFSVENAKWFYDSMIPGTTVYIS